MHSGQRLTRSVWRPVLLPPRCRRSHGLKNSPTRHRYPPTERSNAPGESAGLASASRAVCFAGALRRSGAESAGHELVVSRLQIRRQRRHIALPFGVADRCQNAAQVSVLVRMGREITAEVGLRLRPGLRICGRNHLVGSGCAVRYCSAEPVTEETVASTPAGLQSGAAVANGAAAIPIAIPPSTHPALMLATRRRATILLIFIMSVVLQIELD